MSTTAEQPATPEWSLIPFSADALAALALGPHTVISDMNRLDRFKPVESAVCRVLKTPAQLALGHGDPLGTEPVIMNNPMSGLIVPKGTKTKPYMGHLQWGFAVVLPFTGDRFFSHPLKTNQASKTADIQGFDVLFGCEFLLRGNYDCAVFVDTTYSLKDITKPGIILMQGLMRRTLGKQRIVKDPQVQEEMKELREETQGVVRDSKANIEAKDDKAKEEAKKLSARSATAARRIAEFALRQLPPTPRPPKSVSK